MEDEEARPADGDTEIIIGQYFGPDAGAARTIEELRLLAAGEKSTRTLFGPIGRSASSRPSPSSCQPTATF